MSNSWSGRLGAHNKPLQPIAGLVGEFRVLCASEAFSKSKLRCNEALQRLKDTLRDLSNLRGR